LSENNCVHISKANSITDQMARYYVLTEIYYQKNYLGKIQTANLDKDYVDFLSSKDMSSVKNGFDGKDYDEFLQNGLLIKFKENSPIYIDKFHWNSIPFIAYTGDEIVGSARLIQPDGLGLPTIHDPQIKIWDEFKWIFNRKCVEFSQYAVKRGFGAPISIGLLKIAYLFSKFELNIDTWVATIDNSVLRLLNSRFFNFNLPPIGPMVDYLGSSSTPVLIDLEQALNNAAAVDTSKPIADFIRNIENQNFEDLVLINM